MKKGQSQIITTVLIILLVLAAIVIIWQVVQGTVKGGADQVEIDQFSLGANIESFSVTGNTATVSVHRNAGEGTLDKVILIFEDTSGTTYKYEDSTNKPGPLETETYSLTPSSPGLLGVNFATIKSVAVHFIYSSNGKDITTRELDKNTKATSGGTPPATCGDNTDGTCPIGCDYTQDTDCPSPSPINSGVLEAYYTDTGGRLTILVSDLICNSQITSSNYISLHGTCSGINLDTCIPLSGITGTSGISGNCNIEGIGTAPASSNSNCYTGAFPPFTYTATYNLWNNLADCQAVYP